MSSTNHDRPTAGELVPVKFSRLTRRGVLLGLSLTQLPVCQGEVRQPVCPVV